MKKRIIAVLFLVFAFILSALFLPIPKGSYNDGGTKVFSALTYKIVVWNRLTADVDEDGSGGDARVYHKTSVFWFPYRLKSIDELWKIETAASDNDKASQAR